MKVLYAIQGTGNGHISRARDIVPVLQERAQLDLLISGHQSDLALPYPVTYQLKGMSFVFGKSGGIDLVDTYRQTDTRCLYKDVRQLPVEKYDLVINDFEPVSAWACQFKKIPCISLSHQSAILSRESPQPEKKDKIGKMILRHYAPAKVLYGFHFACFDEQIFTPVIRQQIRQTDIKNLGHYTVYLPAYCDEKIIKRLTRIAEVEWQVFSKHTRKSYRHKNVFVRPIENEPFIKSLAEGEGILCGAGFETPAEALYLNKKLMVLPMKNQYEQHCNAAALRTLGIPVLKNFKKKRIPQIEVWIQRGRPLEINYPDITEEVVEQVLTHHDNTHQQLQSY